MTRRREVSSANREALRDLEQYSDDPGRREDLLARYLAAASVAEMRTARRATAGATPDEPRRTGRPRPA
jgi:hypothetical protein